MKTDLGRRGAIIALLLLSSACASSGPTSPSGTSQPAALPSPTPMPSPSPPVTNLPPLSGPSRTFVFDRELSYRVREYTKHSRFVLYDNGAFSLQYVSLGDFKYHGRYTEANSVVTFDFGGASDANGRLEGNSLTIRYSLNMQMSDFEDAVYVLVP